MKKLEKKEQTPTKKSKDQKLRDYFERQFQELRKQREDKERLQRSGQRIRSEAEMEEVMDGLQVQELEDKKMRSYAVIPPIMYDNVLTEQHRFNNCNGLIDDPMSLYKDTKVINIWTEGEKEIFREKYLLHPKNFGLIASYLERKSVAECVHFYYLSKKTENYKQLLKKHAKKRTRALAKQQQQANAQANRGSPMIKDGTIERTTKSYPQSATSVILPYAQPLTSGCAAVMITIPAPSEAKVPKASTSTVTTILNKTSFTLTTAASSVNSSTMLATIPTAMTATKPSDSSDSVANNNNNKCSDTTSDNEDSAAGAICDGADGLDQDISCCLCSDKVENFAKSRPVSASNLSLYGLMPVDYKSGQRVCLKCHLKNVRRHCPIPSCNTPRRKLKGKLKALPSQWIEMPAEQKERYAIDLGIPIDSKIGCARCVMRISRKIGIVTNSTSTINSAGSESQLANSSVMNDSCLNNSNIGSKGKSKKAAVRKGWTNSEIDQLRNAIKQHGKNWQQISASFGGAKSANDCKKLFVTNKRECNLGSPLREYNESIGKDNKLDTDSDDELSNDSDADTSSLDEIDNVRDRNSDSASASSQAEPNHEQLSKTPNIPPPPQTSSLQDLKSLSASQGSLKSDYDSSATMSADEGNAPELSSNTSTLSTTSTAANSTTSNATSLSIFSRCTSSLFNSNRHYELLNSIPTQNSIVPTFLINPNAPSIQNHHHILTSSANNLHHSSPHPNSVSFGTLAPHNSSNTVVSTAAHNVGNKEEPTCVRDLIYKAIEMSLQPETKNGSSSSAPQLTSDSLSSGAAIQYHRATPNTLHPTTTPTTTPPLSSTSYALNLKRESTPNKPEGLAIYPSYINPNSTLSVAITAKGTTAMRVEQDEVQDLSKKPTDRKPTPIQPQIDSLRPNSQGSPYNESKLPISSSLRSSPSLKSHPQSSTTPTLYQQQMSSLPQPAHANSTIHPFNSLETKKPSPFSTNILPILQQQQTNSSSVQDRNKLKTSVPSMLIPTSMPQLLLQTPPTGLPSTKNSPFQLSPKSIANSNAVNASSVYRDKILSHTVGGGGSITQGTPVVIPGQQPFLTGAGKFLPPQSAAAMHINASNYEAMLRRMGNSAGSITAGTPLTVSQPPSIPGLTVSTAVSSLTGNSNRRDLMADLKPPVILPRGTNIYDKAIEQFYKCNSSPNSQTLTSPYHRPFSPNYQTPFGPAVQPPAPPPLPSSNKPQQIASNKDQLSNQLLIDFNTSKQMHRRSNSSSDKEHILPNNVISDTKHRPPSNVPFHLGSTPPPNSGIYISDRGTMIREDGKPLSVPPPDSPQWNQGLSFISVCFASVYNILTNLLYI